MSVRVVIAAGAITIIILSAATVGFSGTAQVDCGDCHSAILGDGERHFFEGNEDCGFCHEVDRVGADHKVLTFSSDDVCLACHPGQDPLQSSSEHEGINCADCHEPHGSSHEYSLRSPVVSLCQESCHTDGDLGVSHPVGDNVPDITTNADMTCVSSCHSNHQSSEPKLLKMARNDLCRQCHPTMY